MFTYIWILLFELNKLCGIFRKKSEIYHSIVRKSDYLVL